MATNPTAQTTDFSRDVMGRYVCNGLDEALRSTDKTIRPDARPFDIIVIGGGSFGAVLAQHLFYADKAHSHRILVLEGGPLVVPEHVQNLPMLGLDPPGATSIADLRNIGQDRTPRNEVWGLPWHSTAKFPGLAYCLGGRSLFFGGWSPQLLDAETPTSLWPSTVLAELNSQYFGQASEQIGTNATNDFIYGSLHEALRQILFQGINTNKVTDAIPLAQLPLHLDDVPPGQENLFKLEAPLAVQSNTPRSGFFPFNKFSTAPLLIKAARTAQSEANNDDVKKRLMVVPNCHVNRLTKVGDRVTEVQTNQGNIPVPANGAVIIALGTIESTRLALLSFGGISNYNLIGKNLIAHLRSNLTIRIPRTALPANLTQELQASALFVKGRHQHTDGTVGHFHLQITAAGLGAMGTNSEAELFKKIPDIDTFDAFRSITDTHVVITIRAIGEMVPHNPNSFVRLDPESDEFGVPRSFVAIANPLQPGGSAQSINDQVLWDAMDTASDDVAKVFAGGQLFEVLTPQGIVKASASDDLKAILPYDYSGRRDGLGTTHHEAGTLWMGNDPNTSVTNSDGRFHQVANAYVAGPAVFPTLGSPNPMLTGVALVRRLGDRLGKPTPFMPTDGFTPLFDGFTTNNWRMSTIKNQPGKDNPGTFIVVDGTLEALPGSDIGLYWCTTPTPPDFILKLEWLSWQQDDNSGVFIRFPNPESKGYDNAAYVGVDFGFEVQIDALGRGSSPPGKNVDARFRTTGAIYNEDSQNLTLQPVRPLGQWNEYEIRVQGQTYTVFLNGNQVTTFQNPYPNRGLPSGANAPSFIGLQTHTGRVAFRNIRIKSL
ncbi:MAG TPA: family 16 glycoside hydrolase [Chroococcales cyanobacterium]